MALRTRFTSTVLSTLAVTGALLVGSQPQTAQAADPVLTAGLEEMAAALGDQFGRIFTQDVAGGTIYLAVLRRGYVLYTEGDPVNANDTLGFCQQGSTGGLSGCQQFVAPSPTDYECPNDGIDSWCECEGITDCIDMFWNGPCTDGGDMACGGEGDDIVCACEA